MSWGLGWGFKPWGGGSGITTFGLLTAVAVRENVVRLLFSEPVYWTGWLDPFDGSRSELYSVGAVTGTVGIDGKPVRDVAVITAVPSNPTPGAPVNEVDVIVDRPFSPFGTRYIVNASLNLVSVNGTPLDITRTGLEFDGLQRGLAPATPDLQPSGGDIANPQSFSALLDPLPTTDDDSLLGTFPVDDQGDYARDEGLTSLKKRIIRRLTTRKNAFAHLPGYGVDMPANVKRLALPGLREALAADAEEQVRQEPEVIDARVTLTNEGEVTRYRVKARTNVGNGLDFSFPFKPIGD